MTDAAFKPDQKRRVALITGAGGQDGFFLSHQLGQRGYKVHGISRAKPKARSCTEIEWHVGDFLNAEFLHGLLR